jgi:hypothetical protein
VPTAVALEPDKADELWIKDARLEEVSGPAFLFGVESNPRNEINMEGATCRGVPVFAVLRESGKRFVGPAETYIVKTFSHGLQYSDIGNGSPDQNLVRRRSARSIRCTCATRAASRGRPW